jgi:hypothetical protein
MEGVVQHATQKIGSILFLLCCTTSKSVVWHKIHNTSVGLCKQTIKRTYFSRLQPIRQSSWRSCRNRKFPSSNEPASRDLKSDILAQRLGHTILWQVISGIFPNTTFLFIIWNNYLKIIIWNNFIYIIFWIILFILLFE